MKTCITGAGIFGMAAALELRRRGHEVTLVELGGIPNPEASSTDVSKVIRRTNYPNEIYVELGDAGGPPSGGEWPRARPAARSTSRPAS